MATKASAGNTYRSDLSHAVQTLGAAIRSLDRMQRYDLTIPMQENLNVLSRELRELRKEEQREREAKQS